MCVCMCVYVYVYVYVDIYIYIYMYVCMCIYFCIYMCVCVYMCVYIYIYYFYIMLCLIFIVLCISYLSLFKSRHIPLPLFRKCIWSHANIWDGASFCNSLQSLAIDCIYFILVVCIGSACVSGYFVLRETIGLLMQ